MRQRATRYALVFLVLAAPMAAALPAGSASAHGGPARAQVLAVAHATTLASRVVHRSTYQPRHLAAHRRLQHTMVFAWPAQGTVSQGFKQPPYGNHDGIDIGSLRSLAVTAAHAGRVIHVGYTTGYEGYGNIVDVEVAPGVETLYAHLSSMRVHVGERVETGQSLGTAGCTGICYGTHLHFEVRRDGRPIDPFTYLGRG